MLETQRALVLLNDTQYAHLKSLHLDTEASLLNLTECFNPFDAETTSDCRLLNNFSDCISFHPYNYSSFGGHKSHLESLDCLCLKTSSFSSTPIVVIDASAIPLRSMQTISAVYFWRLV